MYRLVILSLQIEKEDNIMLNINNVANACSKPGPKLILTEISSHNSRLIHLCEIIVS